MIINYQLFDNCNLVSCKRSNFATLENYKANKTELKLTTTIVRQITTKTRTAMGAIKERSNFMIS